RRASEEISRKPTALHLKPPYHRPLCLSPSHLAPPVLAPVLRGNQHDNTRTAKARTSTNSEVSARISSTPAPSHISPASDTKINATHRGNAVYSRRAKINTSRSVVSSQTADQMHENTRRWRDLNREVITTCAVRACAQVGFIATGIRRADSGTNSE
ncbi:hypothetical protein JG688_00012995, partial [Phytophthora aleatoria]